MLSHALDCPDEDELLQLVHGSLADAPALERHLADCATCSSLVAALVRDQPAWDSLAGTRLGPYRLDAQIGAGGMGVVYRALDTRLDRAIAIKVLHAEVHTRRLATEARAAASVDHPAIAAIHDVGSIDGTAYVAMELVEGETLRSVIDRLRRADGDHLELPVTRARALLIELADALAAAHARGVVHRDLKPENLIVAPTGRLRVLDFGLAKLLDAGPLDATEPGAIQGTAGYMAPEQARGEPADPRADLFATGAIAYELVTGRRAFPGGTHADRLSATLRDTPPLDDLGALAPIVGRLLAKDPRARFQSAADLGWALAQADVAPARSARANAETGDDEPGDEGTRETSAPARWSRRHVLAAGAAAIATGVGGFLLGRRRPEVASTSPPSYLPLTFRTGRVYTARFAHDGNRLAFGAAWDAEPLRAFVVDLGAGGTTPLGITGDVLAISARGETAACLGRRFTDHQSATGTLAVVPLAGGEPRVLADDIQEADFAPDGRIAVVRRRGDGFAIELPLGTAIVESPGWITHARVSPDGGRVAYLEHPDVDDDAGDLVIVDVATHTRTTLAADWASIAGLAWESADELWFTAGRTHAENELHAITMAGELRSIARTTGRLRLHDVRTVDGEHRAAVTVDTWRLRTFVGGGGREDRDRSLSEVSFVSDMSSDGNTLLIAELGNPTTAAGVYLTPVASDRTSALRLGDGAALAISPAGTRVAASVVEAGRTRLVAYATRSADRPEIAAPGPVTHARWLDEDVLVGLADRRLWRLALGTSPIALAETGLAGRFVVDPTRTRIAVVDPRGRLHVIDARTGRRATVPGTFPRRTTCGWLATGEIVACTPTTPLELVRVDPETGATTPHLTIRPPPVGLKAVDSLVLHDDGVRYAYSCGHELSQLFAMTLG